MYYLEITIHINFKVILLESSEDINKDSYYYINYQQIVPIE